MVTSFKIATCFLLLKLNLEIYYFQNFLYKTTFHYIKDLQ